jgi:hypothetical protein
VVGIERADSVSISTGTSSILSGHESAARPRSLPFCRVVRELDKKPYDYVCPSFTSCDICSVDLVKGRNKVYFRGQVEKVIRQEEGTILSRQGRNVGMGSWLEAWLRRLL